MVSKGWDAFQRGDLAWLEEMWLPTR
jgi:hypothetical protein